MTLAGFCQKGEGGGETKKRAQFTKSEKNLAMVLDIHIVV